MATIRIKNLSVRTYIGFKPHELNQRQEVLINIEYKTDVTQCIKTDSPVEIVDYRTICKHVLNHVLQSRYSLLETLTQSILDIVMSYRDITWAKVEVDKPGALRFSESVSVQLEAIRKSTELENQIYEEHSNHRDWVEY